MEIICLNLFSFLQINADLFIANSRKFYSGSSVGRLRCAAAQDCVITFVEVRNGEIS